MAQLYLVSITLCSQRPTITCDLDIESGEDYDTPSENWPFKMSDDSDEWRNTSRGRKNQLSKQGTAQSKIWALIHVLANESVEGRVASGTEVFTTDSSHAELRQEVPLSPRARQIALLKQQIRDIERDRARNSVSNLDLATFTSTNTVTEEADGDILPPHPEAHQQESLNRTQAKPTLPSKVPKKKMSFDIFNRSKKSAGELNVTSAITISGPIGPVTHTGYANAVERATNFSIPRPAESLAHTSSASNDPKRVGSSKAHSASAEGVFSPITTSEGAASLEERITQLQREAKEDKARVERQRSETTTAKNGDKATSLGKSKSMFFNAKQAVVRKFSSGAEKESKTTPDFYRRVAEDTNLGSPKVQFMMGSRVRKPLPTSQSTDRLPRILEDPSTDTKMGGYLSSPYSQSSPELDLSQHKNKQPEGSSPPPLPQFSSKVSGLAQHGRVGVFARAPVSAPVPDRLQL